jgi:O-antigen/teichoic acid export membrane protein
MLKNVLGKWAEILLTTASVFILYPVLVGRIGEMQYGVWLLLMSIAGYFSLLSMGVPLSTVRFLSKYWAKEDYDKANEVVGTSLTIFGVIALLAAARVAALIAFGNMAASFLFEVAEGALHAMQEQFVLAVVRSAMVVLRLVATLLLVHHDNGLSAIASILAVSTVVQGIMLWLYLRRFYPKMRFRLSAATRSMLKEIFSYSVWALGMNLAGLVSFRTDPIVIGSVISVGAIIYFAVSNNLLLYLSQAMEGIAQALMPRVSHMEARDGARELGAVYMQTSRLTLMLMQAACVMFVLIGPDFLALWMGEEFRGPSGRVLIILSAAYGFYLVQRGVAVAILLGTGDAKTPTLMMAASAVVNVVLSVILGRLWGIEGVAWGTTIALWGLTVALVIDMTRRLKVPILRYLVYTHFVPMLATLLLIVPTLVLRRLMAFDSFAKLVLVGCVAGAAYLVGCFYLLEPHHRVRVLTLLRLRAKTSG